MVNAHIENQGLFLRLFGTLSVQAPDGTDLTPYKSAKSQALLALLAMAPNFERSRDFLADKLWSDRQPKQAAGSLKTELYELRRALGPFKDIITSRHGLIQLDGPRITRDIDQPDFTPDTGAEFLEGIRVRDPQFENWLRNTRQSFHKTQDHGHKPRLLFRSSPGQDLSHDLFLGGYSQSIADWCAEKLVEADSNMPDLTPKEGVDYLLRHTVVQTDEKVSSSFAMLRVRDDVLMWQHASTYAAQPDALFQDTGLYSSINHRVDRTLFEIAPENGQSSEAAYLNRSTLGAVRLLFRNRGADMAIARRHLRTAQEATGRGLHCAWLAYSLCFDKAESNVETQALRDEAEALCRRALELEPFNSMTLALVSYTTTLLLQNPMAGRDLASRAIEINRANPLAWSFQAAALYHLRDIDAAVQSADYARKIAGDGPYRYAVETYFCIAATLANRVEDAIRAGETAAMLKPDFKASQRYLAMLYSHQKDEVNLARVVDTLRRTEPDFSVRKMLEMSEYPSDILRSAAISTIG
ncbi:MAG: hypothetical protein N4A53_02095 [Pelagimonas sp.]|jgi:tetratricopeptide (TPR) repeat protein|nr:hypothetical protein [Pelagimonas sp.]